MYILCIIVILVDIYEDFQPEVIIVPDDELSQVPVTVQSLVTDVPEESKITNQDIEGHL
jgi:hypothetical protein